MRLIASVNLGVALLALSTLVTAPFSFFLLRAPLFLFGYRSLLFFPLTGTIAPLGLPLLSLFPSCGYYCSSLVTALSSFSLLRAPLLLFDYRSLLFFPLAGTIAPLWLPLLSLFPSCGHHCSSLITAPLSHQHQHIKPSFTQQEQNQALRTLLIFSVICAVLHTLLRQLADRQCVQQLLLLLASRALLQLSFVTDSQGWQLQLFEPLYALLAPFYSLKSH